MKSFDKGIGYYTRGLACIHVSFPEDEVCCHYCRFCRSEPELKRWWCRLTNEMIYNPFIKERGRRCPVGELSEFPASQTTPVQGFTKKQTACGKGDLHEAAAVIEGSGDDK